nr:MAG TPA: hypothetical protein [Bacteriophage sp.]
MSTKECEKKLLELGIFIYALLILFMAILAIYILFCNGDTKKLVDVATVL